MFFISIALTVKHGVGLSHITLSQGFFFKNHNENLLGSLDKKDIKQGIFFKNHNEDLLGSLDKKDIKPN